MLRLSGERLPKSEKVSIAKPNPTQHHNSFIKFFPILFERKCSFSYPGVNVWNKLSTEIKNAPSLATFKNLLKQSLKNERV